MVPGAECSVLSPHPLFSSLQAFAYAVPSAQNAFPVLLHLCKFSPSSEARSGALTAPPLAPRFPASQQEQGTEQLQMNKTGMKLAYGLGLGEIWTVPWPAPTPQASTVPTHPGPRASAMPEVGGLGGKEANSPQPQYHAATPRGSSFLLSTPQFAF